MLFRSGLLANHDTERLLLQGLERTSLGIRKDTGAEMLGRFGPWDYAVSASDGLSDVRFVDSRANLLMTTRLGYVRNDLAVGFSALAGSVLLDPSAILPRLSSPDRDSDTAVPCPFS